MGLTMTAVFSVQASIYRKPVLNVFAGTAWMPASCGICPFLHVVSGGHANNIFQPNEIFLATSIGAFLLYICGSYMGKRQLILSKCNTSWLIPVSVVSTLLISVSWAFYFGPIESLSALVIMSWFILLCLLVLHCLHWNRLPLSIWCVVYSYTMGIVIWLKYSNPSFSTFISVVSLALLV